jgi:hypothetical protein
MLSYYILMIFNKNICQTGAAGAYDNVQEGAGRGHVRAVKRAARFAEQGVAWREPGWWRVGPEMKGGGLGWLDSSRGPREERRRAWAGLWRRLGRSVGKARSRPGLTGREVSWAGACCPLGLRKGVGQIWVWVRETRVRVFSCLA